MHWLRKGEPQSAVVPAAAGADGVQCRTEECLFV